MSDRSTEQRAILQVCWGPMASRKAVLEPGHVLRIGRDEAAGFVVSDDSQLSGAHFELAWDGAECRIRDLETKTGTLLNGQSIQEGLVFHGSWIRAGGTDFVMHLERYTPPALAEVEAESPQRYESKRQALSMLTDQEGLYAVLDTTRSERMLPLLRESVEEHRSLYEGPQGAALADIAPYLVRLPKGSRLLASLVQEGWGNCWGIYLSTQAPLVDLRRHLRKLLMVELDGLDGRFYFRFYDPRVLHIFLPTFSADQRKEFLGPITHLFHEDAQDGHPLTTSA